MRENRASMGFIDWLTIVFITLKLCDVITWSWWIVLSPMIVTLIIVAIVAVVQNRM